MHVNHIRTERVVKIQNILTESKPHILLLHATLLSEFDSFILLQMNQNNLGIFTYFLEKKIFLSENFKKVTNLLT